MEKMMAEYVAGVDLYLSQVRDSSTKDAKMHQVSRETRRYHMFRYQ